MNVVDSFVFPSTNYFYRFQTASRNGSSIGHDLWKASMRDIILCFDLYILSSFAKEVIKLCRTKATGDRNEGKRLCEFWTQHRIQVENMLIRFLIYGLALWCENGENNFSFKCIKKEFSFTIIKSYMYVRITNIPREYTWWQDIRDEVEKKTNSADFYSGIFKFTIDP